MRFRHPKSMREEHESERRQRQRRATHAARKAKGREAERRTHPAYGMHRLEARARPYRGPRISDSLLGMFFSAGFRRVPPKRP